MGFIQTLLALGSKSIEDVASAVTFVLSSCVAALLGMILAGAPLEDRAARSCGGGGARTVGRLASAIFPLVALIFLIVIFVLVVTPIEIEAYAASGLLIKTLRFKDMKDFGGGLRRPATMETDSPLHKDHKSVMLYGSIKAKSCSDESFTLDYLPRAGELR